MAVLELSDDLAAKLRDLAQKEQRSVGDLLADMLRRYQPTQHQGEAEISAHNPLLGLVGLLDEFTQETDLSSTVHETLKPHDSNKNG